VTLERLVGLGVLLAVAACQTTEEVSPPPLRTSPAAERRKPDETNNAQLKDSPGIIGETQPSGPSATGCTKSGLMKGAGQAKTISVWGAPRSYVLSVPQGYGELPQSWRLVFAFHAGGGTGAGLRGAYDTDQRFAEKGAIVVYPDAADGTWDLDSPSDQNPDIAFFDTLLAEITAKACIDATRIFSVGFSNGAYFANQLGCRRGSVFRAIAPHAGGGPYGPGSSYDAQGNLVCVGTPPAVKIFHAEDDYTVPISHAEASIQHWTWANGCQDSTHGAAPDPCTAYEGCSKPVEVCRYWGVGHAMWSGGAKATWDFFAGF
jgi:polyhydroxybutyrate depolymerase